MVVKGKSVKNGPRQQTLEFSKKPGENSDKSKSGTMGGLIGSEPAWKNAYAQENTATCLLEDQWDKWDLSILAMLIDAENKTKGPKGNALYQYWTDSQFAEQMGDDCQRYSDRFTDPPNR